MSLNGSIFWKNPSFSGEPQSAEAKRRISLEIVFAESKIVIGVF